MSDATYATMFRLLLPDDFSVKLRRLRVRETMPDDGKRARRLNKWASELWRSTLRVPVQPCQIRREPSILVPSSVVHKCTGLEFFDVPGTTYHLDLCPEEINVSLDERDPDKRLLVSELLKRSITDRVSEFRGMLWRWDWSTFFYSKAENAGVQDRIIDVFRGFKFTVIWDDTGLFLALDARTKDIGRLSLSSYLEGGDVGQITAHLNTQPREAWERRPRFVRDNGPVRFPCVYSGETHLTASEATFVDLGGRDTTVAQYYRQRYGVEVPAKDPVVYVRDSENRDPIMVPASRLFPVFDTEQARDLHRSLQKRPDFAAIFPPAQIPPGDRMEMVTRVSTLIAQFRFNQWEIGVSESPVSRMRTCFYPPDLGFGNGALLKYGDMDGAHASAERQIVAWTQSKMPSLYKHGVYDAGDLPRTILAFPADLSTDVRSKVKDSIEEEVSKQLRRSFSLDGILLYRDLTRAKDLIDCLSKEVGRTQYLVCLHRNLKSSVHDTIKMKSPSHISTQCFSSLTAQRIAEGRVSYARNLVLAALIDVGAKPWILRASLSHDVYIGIDVLRNRAAYHFFWGEHAEQMRFFSGQSSSQARRQEAIKRPLLAQAIYDGIRTIYNSTKRPVRSTCIHRDGTWWPSESTGLAAALVRLRKEGMVSEDHQATVVEVRKSHFPIRLMGERSIGGNRVFVNPVPGVYWVLDSGQAVICSSSKPFAWDGQNGRTAGTILVRIAEHSGTPDIVEVARDVYYLTQLNWAAPDIDISVPVTIRWADDRLREALFQAAETGDDWMEDEEDEEDEVIA